MTYRWLQKATTNTAAVKKLNESLNISGTLAEILVQRGILDFEEAKSFFRPQLEMLHDPFLMKDMAKAVEEIETAIGHDEKIMVYGDYDVDGTTAVSVVYSFLKKQYPNVISYIPDRYKEGYGISLAGIDFAESEGCKLIIALDCGIKAIKQVSYASEKGIDFIICDHHQPGQELPQAKAILNPKQADCHYPFDELSGCGVGFKLVQALCQHWSLPDNLWQQYLDLVAVSIGADIVPIVGENRVLAYYGLKKINENPSEGIHWLKVNAGKEKDVLSISDVVFLLGPRINAAGRISHGKLAVALLTGTVDSELENIANTIGEQNQNRKELDSSITKEALQMIIDQKEEKRRTTVLFKADWHKGVIGIVASRLIENHYRPTVVFTESNGVLAGSARSVHGFNVYDALNDCSDILEQFGGHKYAAGMTLKLEQFEAFKTRFEQVVTNTILPEQLTPQLTIDATLLFKDLTPKFYRVMHQMGPFGPQNMAPTFVSHHLLDAGSKKVGADKTHLHVRLKCPDTNLMFKGIAFGMAPLLAVLQSGDPISVVYHVEENSFRGETQLQLRIKDLKLTANTN